MKLLLGIFVFTLLSTGIAIGYFGTKLYNKSIFLGFVTTLMGIIIPFCLFIGFIYLYGLYHNGYPLQFKW